MYHQQSGGYGSAYSHTTPCFSVVCTRERARWLTADSALPPPPSRTNWTSLVPLPVLTGRVSSPEQADFKERIDEFNATVKRLESAGGSQVDELVAKHKREMEAHVQAANLKYNEMLRERLDAEEELRRQARPRSEISHVTSLILTEWLSML